MDCEVCRLLNNEKSLVFQTDYWKVFVMNEQSYLGRCVVSCKRHCPSISDLTIEEWNNFKEVTSKLEKAAKSAFGSALVNWSCLMNDAFNNKPYNPHVHWHFRPRYDRPVDFAGKQFTDPDFGEHYKNHRTYKANDKLVENVVNALKGNLG